MARDMPCGCCCVCDGDLDHSEAGFCAICGEGFHWGECGGWSGGKHACFNCEPDEGEDQ